MRWVALVVVTGCGRLAFEPIGGDGGPSGEDGACADPCALAPALLDDTFDRPDGTLGAEWIAPPGAFTIANNQLAVTDYATALYADGPVTGDKWIQVTLAAPNPEQEFGIVLGARTASSFADRFLIAYHPTPGNSHLHFSVVLSEGFLPTTSLAATAPPGTRLRVISRGGMIEVYFDEILFTMDAPMMWPYPDLDGYIGVFASYDGFPVRLDDFGGGPCGCP